MGRIERNPPLWVYNTLRLPLHVYNTPGQWVFLTFQRRMAPHWRRVQCAWDLSISATVRYPRPGQSHAMSHYAQQFPNEQKLQFIPPRHRQGAAGPVRTGRRAASEAVLENFTGFIESCSHNSSLLSCIRKESTPQQKKSPSQWENRLEDRAHPFGRDP